MTVCFFLVWFSFKSLAQEQKNEKETPIKVKNVPAYILECLEDYIDKKTKFYREVDGEHKSYEVKFKFNDNSYSVEFDDSLKLEDVELVISKEEIEDSTLQNIESQLAKHKKFKFIKIQIQYSSKDWTDQKVIEAAILNQTGDVIQYEIEVGVKDKGEWKFIEMTFAQNGDFLFEREILERSSNYILY